MRSKTAVIECGWKKLFEGTLKSTPPKNIIKEAGSTSVAIKYGSFLNTIIDFVIIAFSIFIAVKMINKFRRLEVLGAARISKQEQLLTEIRDLLKNK